MMNPFPTMFLSLVAYAVLRIFVGVILFRLGYQHATTKSVALRTALGVRIPRVSGLFALYLALGEILIGLMFIAGFYTQIAALIAIVYSLKMLYLRKTLTYPLVPPSLFYILLIGVSISLFITGAGVLAFDIPI